MSNPPYRPPTPPQYPEPPEAPEPVRKEKTAPATASLQILSHRITQLEKEVAELQQNTLADSVLIDRWYRQGKEVKAKLLQTIEAVKRLAKGKSLGTLGLPSDEEWDQGL